MTSYSKRGSTTDSRLFLPSCCASAYPDYDPDRANNRDRHRTNTESNQKRLPSAARFPFSFFAHFVVQTTSHRVVTEHRPALCRLAFSPPAHYSSFFYSFHKVHTSKYAMKFNGRERSRKWDDGLAVWKRHSIQMSLNWACCYSLCSTLWELSSWCRHDHATKPNESCILSYHLVCQSLSLILIHNTRVLEAAHIEFSQHLTSYIYKSNLPKKDMQQHIEWPILDVLPIGTKKR